MEANHFPYTIRWALPEDWDPAIEMVWRTFLKFEGRDYSQEGIDNFDTFIHDGSLRRMFLSGSYQVLLALDKSRVIGLASVRNTNHLSLLFVDENYHHQGIGRTLMGDLFRYLAEEAGEHSMTLTAAPYAVGFYKKLGFYAMRPEEQVAGIRVTFMEKLF